MKNVICTYLSAKSLIDFREAKSSCMPKMFLLQVSLMSSCRAWNEQNLFDLQTVTSFINALYMLTYVVYNTGMGIRPNQFFFIYAFFLFSQLHKKSRFCRIVLYSYITIYCILYIQVFLFYFLEFFFKRSHVK